MVMGAYGVANIYHDKGDVILNGRDDFEPYDYDEESKDPAPPVRDNCGRLL